MAKRKRKGGGGHTVRFQAPSENSTTLTEDNSVNIYQELSEDGILTSTAVEQAVSIEVPKDLNHLDISNPRHLDSIASAAVLNIRKRGNDITDDIMQRVRYVAGIIKSKYLGWSPAAFPTVENPWRDEQERFLAAFYFLDTGNIRKRSAGTHTVFHKRLSLMERWLQTGEIFDEILERNDTERKKAIEALDSHRFFNLSIRESGIASIRAVIFRDGKTDILDHLMYIGFCVSPLVIISSMIFDANHLRGRIVLVYAYDESVFDVSIVGEIKISTDEWKRIQFGLIDPIIPGIFSPILPQRSTVDAIIEMVEKHYACVE